MEWPIELPICLRKILVFSAYDSENSLRLLDEVKISEIERYISECGRSVIDELDCCHSEKYKNQTTFRFLPGHRSILLNLSKHAHEFFEISVDQKYRLNEQSNESYSVVLSELIKTAQNNSRKHKNKASYSEIIRYFCTFIYLTSGKACYEILHQNLPIPSVKTVRKYEFSLNFNSVFNNV